MKQKKNEVYMHRFLKKVRYNAKHSRLVYYKDVIMRHVSIFRTLYKYILDISICLRYQQPILCSDEAFYFNIQINVIFFI